MRFIYKSYLIILTIIVPIVQSTIVDNQAKIVTKFAKFVIFSTVQFILHLKQIHGPSKGQQFSLADGLVDRNTHLLMME